MLQRDLPIRILCARVLDCGQPWHGLSVASELDFGGVDPMAWPQPDSGDCWSVHVPGAAGGTQDPQTNEYHQWLDYGLLSGWWQRQLYGQVLPAGRLSYLYTYGVGHTYVVDITSITFTGDNLGGSLDLHATVASAAPPDTLTLAPDDLDLDAAYTLRDVIAFNADGSQAILGVWPTTYLGETLTYSQSALCRAQARLIYGLHDYRVIPNALVTLDITETAGVLDAALAMLKTPAQMAAQTMDDALYTPGDWPEWSVVDSSIDHAYSGPGDICNLTTETTTYAWVPASASDDAYADRAWEKIVGAYYKPSGEKAYVKLRYVYAFEYQMTVTGSGGGERTEIYGSVWNAGTEACEAVAHEDTGEPEHSTETTGSGLETHTIDLEVDGVVKAAIVYAVDWGYSGGTVRGSPISLTVDGTALPANGLSSGIVGGTKPGVLDLVASYTLANGATEATGVVIHAIRYSNHAWGLALIGLNTGIHGAGNTAYLGGIVNLLDGTRTANIGYRTVGLVGDVLADTYASVQPESLEIEHGHDLMCWV
jgi:hypothetical protein